MNRPNIGAKYRSVLSGRTTSLDVDFGEVERRVLASGVLPEQPSSAPKPEPKRARDRFPNTGEVGEPCGRYGMFRTVEGHEKAIRRCLRTLRSISATFDCIYCTGLSGSVPAATVAYLMKKSLLVLRKQTHAKDTMSHGTLLEGSAQYINGTRYLILDDFVSGGGTLKRLVRHLPSNGSLVGVMLYGQPRSQAEREGAPAKLINLARSRDDRDHHPDAHGHEKQWHNLVRRGPDSMLFDLVHASD